MWTKKNIPDQQGKTIIVTGGNTGVGYETALALYEAGAHVVLACRSLQKAAEAIEKMKTVKVGTLEAAELDLSELAAIRKFAAAFTKSHNRLDVLINNAGVMIPPASKTVDGYELQFGTNFIGHYALTGLLFPLLEKTPGARVVTVSSMAYLRGSIDFENFHLEKAYDPMREYAQSKLANIFLATELQKRIRASGSQVISIAAQPGANRTELSRHMDPGAFETAVQRVGGLMDPWQGALPSLYAATVPDVLPGGFYSPDQDGGYRGYPALAELASHATDESVATRLWEYAERETGVKFPNRM